MDRRYRKSLPAFSGCAILLASCLLPALSSSLPAAGTARRSIARRLPIYQGRQSETDLEVTGMVAGLPQGSVGFVRHADLSSLPAITTSIDGDENFSEVKKQETLRVTGVALDVLISALGALPGSDLMDAACVDHYRAHYPASYLAAHHPLLALRINGLLPAEWSARSHRQDLGPYFITHAHFISASAIPAHPEQPQVPSNVVRLNFSTTAATFGALAPRGHFPEDSPEEHGFAIAKQDCLRCHNQGAYGGTKAGRSWMVLGTWAREQPAYFAGYVHDPKKYEEHAKMPGHPSYDLSALAALTAYFRTFALPPVEHQAGIEDNATP